MSRIVITMSSTIFFRLLTHAPEELQREAKEDSRRAIPALCFTEDDIREKFAQEEQWDELSDGEQRGAIQSLIRVRRIYTAPGRADRAVERLDTGSRGEMINRFDEISLSLDVRVERDVLYGYVRERQPDRYPAHEEFFFVGLAVVESKTRYGVDWFEAKWRETLGETGQERLFD